MTTVSKLYPGSYSKEMNVIRHNVLDWLHENVGPSVVCYVPYAGYDCEYLRIGGEHDASRDIDISYGEGWKMAWGTVWTDANRQNRAQEIVVKFDDPVLALQFKLAID